MEPDDVFLHSAHDLLIAVVYQSAPRKSWTNRRCLTTLPSRQEAYGFLYFYADL